VGELSVNCGLTVGSPLANFSSLPNVSKSRPITQPNLLCFSFVIAFLAIRDLRVADTVDFFLFVSLQIRFSVNQSVSFCHPIVFLQIYKSKSFSSPVNLDLAIYNSSSNLFGICVELRSCFIYLNLIL
jgi:hypothetical protein